VRSIEAALDARRQRIIISQSTVSVIKWAGLLLQALCTLIAISFVHSDNRTTCAIALTSFATGVAVSILLIECYSRPFTGEVSVRPVLLQQIISAEGPPTAGP
jgi:positive regulator of sigma E activity